MAHAQTAPGFDPRKIITPESFHVAPHLLGLPLASPSRRLAAILVDLCLVAILANGGKVAFALALSVAFFWVAGKKLGKGGGFFSWSVRAAFRGFGALFLFIAVIAVWNSARNHIDEDDDDGGGRPAQAAMSTTGGHREQHVTVLSAAQVALAVNALEHAEDSATAYAATAKAVRQLRRMNASNAEIREGLQGETKNRPAAVRAGVLAALPPADSAKPASADSTAPEDSVAAAEQAVAAAAAAGPDSLAAVYVGAVHAGDSARATEVRPKLASALARDSLDQLRGQVTELQNDKRELQREKEKAENRGLLSILLEWLDDLGIGIGWTGLYFTALTALMKGQTPGKKLFGIRVLRLDGLPMTLWASFERFGGYAAGLFTGLTGYAQVFWDRNRQAIQDKISETVVIRERRGIPLPTAPAAPPARPQPPRWPPAGVGAQ
jgi:RDD family protein